MKTFTAQSVDLSNFALVRCAYPPKDILAEALQVTPENIGALCLEFETDLREDEHGELYFKIMAGRFDDNGQLSAAHSRLLTIFVDDWLIPLRGELHLFPDEIFMNTFAMEPTQSTPFSSFPMVKAEVDDEVIIVSTDEPGTVVNPHDEMGVEVRVHATGQTHVFNPADLELRAEHLESPPVNNLFSEQAYSRSWEVEQPVFCGPASRPGKIKTIEENKSIGVLMAEEGVILQWHPSEIRPMPENPRLG